MILIITGYPGSGKTTLSKIICKYEDCIRINSDDIRSKLFKEDITNDFTKYELKITYKCMSIIVNKILETDTEKWIVLDGSFRKKNQRESIKKDANKGKYECQTLHITAPDEKIKKRLKKRQLREGGAGPDTFEEVKAVYEPPGDDAIIVDNSGGVKQLHREAEKAIRKLKARM